jgi:hypothetical protein
MMKHLLEFESYEELDEAGIPVYNADDFRRSPSSDPEDEVSATKIFSYISDLLDQQKTGQIDEISMTVDIPTQGKKAPKHIIDTLDAERKRIEREQYAIRGSRVEAADVAPDDNIYGGEGRNLFIDSEYIVTGVTNLDGIDYIIGIPSSKKKEAFSSPESVSYFSTFIEPKQIEEVFYS